MHSNQIDTDGVTRRKALRGIGTGVGLVALGGAAGSPAVANPQNDNGGGSVDTLETWSHYRYDPANTGLAPTEGPTDNISVKWEYEAGDRVTNGAVVWNDTVYIGSNDPDFLALDAETGEERWKAPGSYAYRDAAVYDGTVYYTQNGPPTLRALDAETGELEWEVLARDLYNPDDEEDARHGMYAPTVADGKVFISTQRATEDGFDTENQYSAHALDADSGEELWHFDELPHISQRPPAYHKNGTVYFAPRDQFTDEGTLWAFDAETGENLWRYYPGYIGFTSPTVKNGIVYHHALFDEILFAVDQDTGEELWRLETPHYVFDPPVVKDGIVYYGTYNHAAGPFGDNHDADNSMYAYDPQADEHLWRTKTANVYGYATARDTLYCLGWDTCYGIDIETGDILWSFQTGDETRGTPVVVDGTVYIGSDDGFIYALEEAE